jgi:hypothetical protein
MTTWTLPPQPNFSDWYWNVVSGASSPGVFHSGRGIYVPTTDTAYQAWLAINGAPTSIANEQGLLVVLSQRVPWLVPLFPLGLMAYAQAKQAKIAASGTSANIGTAQSPNMVQASTDTASLILLQGAYTMAGLNASATFNWAQSNGVGITLTAPQVQTIFNTVTAFIQSTFSTLSGVLNAIRAGTITTQAQVDSPPAPIPAWPQVTPTTPSAALRRSSRSPGSSTASRSAATVAAASRTGPRGAPRGSPKRASRPASRPRRGRA